MFLLFSSFFSFAQHYTKNDSVNLYKRLEGKIGQKEVVMYLNPGKSGYYYKQDGKRMNLFIEKNTNNNLVLKEDFLGKKGAFSLTWDESTKKYTGRRTNTFLSLNDESETSKAACNFYEYYPKGSEEIESVYFFDIKREERFNDFKEKASKDYTLNFLFRYINFNENSNLYKWLDKELRDIIGVKSNESWYLGLGRIIEEGIKKNKPAVFDTAQDEKYLDVYFNENNFLILNHYHFYEVRGAAHPSYESKFYCFDLVKKKRLSLNDILIKDIRVEEIIEHFFKEQYGKEKVGFAKNELIKNKKLDKEIFLSNENFYFNELGITFFYDYYEMDAYAAGTTEIFIPFKTLRHYLKPEFKKRINI